MRKRNRHVSVWMNEQEYRHLKKQAELAGLGIDHSSAHLSLAYSCAPARPTPTPPCCGSCRPSAIM